MKIAITYQNKWKVGGADSYLGEIMPVLLDEGYQVGFWHEHDRPSQRGVISLPAGTPIWNGAKLGSKAALAALREWGPDLIFGQGLTSPPLEKKTLEMAPGIFLAHNYYGTCISGGKTLKSPFVVPCQRRFGLPCLLHNYSDQCGGLNPVAMLRAYRRQSSRLKVLRFYQALVTFSAHMRAEYLRHGFAPESVFTIPPFTNSKSVDDEPPCPGSMGLPETRKDPGSGPWRLMFVGRMEMLKGGCLLLDALKKIRKRLTRPLQVIFSGDGLDRAHWESQARQLGQADPGLNIQFIGWQSHSQLEDLWRDCDLAVVPSVWPEPFGLVGPEAGFQGVPVVAFDVGGISEWLTDGVNGCLVSGRPPTAEGLAEGMAKCLGNPEFLARLRFGAKELARRFSLKHHLSALQAVFREVLGRSELLCGHC